MLGDAAFYQQCPHFLWLRDTALAAYAKYKQQECCGGQQHMAHVLDAFFKNLKELHDLDAVNTRPVRAYLEARKRRPVGRIVIFYRDAAKQAAKFVF
jgi:hypothetical protein